MAFRRHQPHSKVITSIEYGVDTISKTQASEMDACEQFYTMLQHYYGKGTIQEILRICLPRQNPPFRAHPGTCDHALGRGLSRAQHA